MRRCRRWPSDWAKPPSPVKNGPGFVVNRVLIPMINEAFFVLAEGLATAEASTRA